MKPPYVIIPNWNGADLIRPCLESLRMQTLKPKVIVVENGSSDDSAEIVRREFSEVRLLEFKDNAGFAGGVNRGIRVALEEGAEYILLLNNDAVAEPEWVQELVTEAQVDSTIGAVTAKILTGGGQLIDSTGDFYSIWGFPYPRGRGEVDKRQYDGGEARDIFAASGGASLYRAVMLREIGLFDERFFAYYEDVDISFRAQLAGWSVRYAPKAVVNHAIGGTSSRIDDYEKKSRSETGQAITSNRPSTFARYHSVKNFIYLYTKNMPGRLYWKYLPLFWASWGMMLISDVKRGLVVSNIRANVRALQDLGGILASRREIQRKRRTPIESIDGKLVHSLPPLQRLRFERLGLARRAK